MDSTGCLFFLIKERNFSKHHLNSGVLNEIRINIKFGRAIQIPILAIKNPNPSSGINVHKK